MGFVGGVDVGNVAFFVFEVSKGDNDDVVLGDPFSFSHFASNVSESYFVVL